MSARSAANIFNVPEPPEFELGGTNRAILRHMLKPITKWLEHDEVEEIQINRPGEIIQRLRSPMADGSLYAFHEDQELSFDYLTILAYSLANSINMTDFGPTGTPVVYGTIPGGHRLVGIIGSNVQWHPAEFDERGSVAFVVRQFTKVQNNNLDRWGITMSGKITKNIKSVLSKDADSNNAYVKIFNSLARGDHLLVSGATGSGKTSLLRALIEQVDRNLRVLTVEDTRELVIPHRNRAHLLMQRSGQNNNFDYKSVVDLIVRMTPDIVMAGEVSVSNAGAIWELMRSGHGHFMTTIHAENIDEALGTFMSRISHTTPHEVNDRERVKAEMKQRLRVIQLERVGEKRRITEIS
ncbi:MAG: hypothetical protein DI537_28355 [Stutzerimonas stutzeri]|nr:MAG: hypothetical protein DI537_28355 [Stutzerimonas stutzeri]